ncbi:hypothetical protein OFC04_24545, partial [Escherichia coli]|nr:hypothetical protein [Escherichia coli]
GEAKGSGSWRLWRGGGGVFEVKRSGRCEGKGHEGEEGFGEHGGWYICFWRGVDEGSSMRASVDNGFPVELIDLVNRGEDEM